jgi:hypothetical protein
VDPRLQGAIGSPKIQSQAGELVGLALRALESLRQLDESLYERFVASRKGSAMDLRQLWGDTFGGLRQLLAFCRSLETERKTEAPAGDVSATFDFGDLEGGTPPPRDQLDLGAGDIGDLLEGLGEEVQKGDAERWAKVVEKVLSIEYGLRSQQGDADARLDVALAAGETNQVLGLLDDTQSSASEGVHALVAAVYEEFLPDVKTATIVPGYLTSLGRALLVRRGLAELATTLAPYNEVLQDPARKGQDFALRTIRDTMQTFVGSVVCRAMRAADRWQMVEFERELAEQPVAGSRLTSEGLVKYLDSLGSISQREVLLLHDQRTIEDMREALANARQLVDISPRTATEMLQRAFHATLRLRGRRPATDELIIQLERYAPSNASDSLELLEKLEAVLAATG